MGKSSQIKNMQVIYKSMLRVCKIQLAVRCVGAPLATLTDNEQCPQHEPRRVPPEEGQRPATRDVQGVQIVQRQEAPHVARHVEERSWEALFETSGRKAWAFERRARLRVSDGIDKMPRGLWSTTAVHRTQAGQAVHLLETWINIQFSYQRVLFG